MITWIKKILNYISLNYTVTLKLLFQSKHMRTEIETGKELNSW